MRNIHRFVLGAVALVALVGTPAALAGSFAAPSAGPTAPGRDPAWG
ncbi:hypothetical protein [Streptomyces sp. NPDC003023]